MEDAAKDHESSQVNRFKETARKLGCDEDEAAFDKKLAKRARHKVKDDTPPD